MTLLIILGVVLYLAVGFFAAVRHSRHSPLMDDYDAQMFWLFLWPIGFFVVGIGGAIERIADWMEERYWKRLDDRKEKDN
jgi:hypothetical protein